MYLKYKDQIIINTDNVLNIYISRTVKHTINFVSPYNYTEFNFISEPNRDELTQNILNLIFTYMNLEKRIFNIDLYITSNTPQENKPTDITQLDM